MNRSETVPMLLRNAIASISTRTTLGPALLQRRDGVPKQPPETVIDNDDGWPPRPWPLPRRTPNLPPQGDLHLALELSTVLGRGRSGRVYEVAIDLSASSSSLAALHIPPLVAKVSHAGKHRDIAHEAYVYGVLDPLQGVAVPRCYGYFEGTEPVSERYDEDGTEDSHGPRSRTLSILLLEKVGDVLPLNQEPPHGALKELEAIYTDISELGVEHFDIRWQNILYALPSPPGMPGLPSPFRNGQPPYRWRIVDFADSQETNVNLKLLVDGQCSYVEDLLDGIAYGYPPERGV